MERDEIVERLIQWAEAKPLVRAMLLTSTRTRPDAAVDVLSDYDVILAVTDIGPFYDDRAWLSDFGPVLVVYKDPLRRYYDVEKVPVQGKELFKGASRRGRKAPRLDAPLKSVLPEQVLAKFNYITQYENKKIDFTIWPVEILRCVAADPVLPPDLDVGYAVLLDKDGLTAGLQPPTYQAYIPVPPDEAAYQTLIEVTFHEATYVAKHLWRGDLMAAKFSLDQMMKKKLRQMLEWQIGITHDWSVKTGAHGRGLQKLVSPEIWSRLKATYVGADEKENWGAMFATLDLLRDVAVQVGEHFGYTYPHDLHRRVVRYLNKVHNLDRSAESFSESFRKDLFATNTRQGD